MDRAEPISKEHMSSTGQMQHGLHAAMRAIANAVETIQPVALASTHKDGAKQPVAMGSAVTASLSQCKHDYIYFQVKGSLHALLTQAASEGALHDFPIHAASELENVMNSCSHSIRTGKCSKHIAHASSELKLWQSLSQQRTFRVMTPMTMGLGGPTNTWCKPMVLNRR